MAELGDVWGTTVAQLNVFPPPRDILALEVLTITEQIGKSLGDSTVEIKDETLAALAELARRTSDPGTLPSVTD